MLIPLVEFPHADAVLLAVAVRIAAPAAAVFAPVAPAPPVCQIEIVALDALVRAAIPACVVARISTAMPAMVTTYGHLIALALVTAAVVAAFVGAATPAAIEDAARSVAYTLGLGVGCRPVDSPVVSPSMTVDTARSPKPLASTAPLYPASTRSVVQRASRSRKQVRLAGQRRLVP